MIIVGDGITMVIPPKRGYKERREFRTQISPTFSGKEFRDSLHEDQTQDLTPLRGIALPVTTRNRQEFSYLENLLSKGQTDSTIKAPLWLSLATLTVATDGTTTINLVTTGMEFVAGGEILLVNARTLATHVVRTIQTVNPTSLVLTASVAAGFGVGDWAMPLLECILSKDTAFDATDFQSGRITLKLQELNAALLFTQPSESLFQGFPEFTASPVDQLKIGVLGDYKLLGKRYQKRAKKVDRPPERTIQFPVAPGSPSERQTLRQFFDARLGKYRAFWTRSHKFDFQVGVAAPSAQAHLDLIDSNELVGLADVVRWIWIPDLNSRHILSNPVQQGNFIRVTVDPVLGADLPVDSWIEAFYLARFDTDVLEFQYGSRGAVQTKIQLRVRELQKETPVSYTP